MKRFQHDPFCFQGSGNLDAIQTIKKLGGGLQDSYLDEGWFIHLKFKLHITSLYLTLKFYQITSNILRVYKGFDNPRSSI